MEDTILWLCTLTGSYRCYVLSPAEKVMYLGGVIVAVIAAVLLFYGTMIRLFTR